MEPQTYNFTIWQGTTWQRLLTYKTAAGVVVNMTGYQVRMVIRRTWGGSLLLALSSASGGGISVASSSPNITITITATQTKVMDFEFAVYDLEIQSPAGVVDRLLEGRVTLKKEATS